MTSRRATLALAVASAALVVAGLGVALAFPSPGRFVILALTAVMAAVPTGFGLLLTRRRPGHRLGPLLAFAGLVPALLLGGEVIDAGPQPPGGDYVTVAGQGAWTLWYAAILVLVLFFPDGRLAGRGARRLLVALAVDVLALMVWLATAPGPFLPPHENVPHVFGTLPEPVSQLFVVTLPGLLVILVLTVVLAVRRFRRAPVEAQVQLKWLAMGAALLPLTLLACWASFLLYGDATVPVLVGLLAMYVVVPAAVGVALLWPDLLDVDRALSATVTHAALTAALLALFTTVNIGAGLLLGTGSTLAAILATALCGVLLAPLRGRLQRRVDRRLYPARVAATTALEELRRRTSSLAEAPEHLEAVLRDALGDAEVRVGFVTPSVGSGAVVDADRRPMTSADHGVPVLLGSERIGVLTAGHTSRDLLREVAAAAAPLVEVVRLRLELRDALAQVEQSRSRLLRIGYEERRRLERDLHDGAQQRLVSLGMSLRLAQRRLGRADGADDVDVVGLLDGAVAELGTAVSELRQLANGIRPSCLDDGLASALSGLVGSLPVTVALDVAAAELPDDVETTAYYVACEAITNAVKHARAEHLQINIDSRGSHLYIRVADDGVGGAEPREGSGLTGLADRVGAHGGLLNIASPSGVGTTVEVVLPCES